MLPKCEWCGHGLSYDPSYAPYPGGAVEVPLFFCDNSDCAGDDEPRCFICRVLQWQAGGKLEWDEKDSDYICLNCQTEEIAA